MKPAPTNERALQEPGAGQNRCNYSSDNFADILVSLRARFSSWLWVREYSFEEARQRYADRRQLLRQAAACLLLALLRLVGVRHG